MFERKKIVIGETYIYDALNETNMAVMTNLVTVIKKAKGNTYTVCAVENGLVFNTPAKYLTPYIEKEKAAVVRCHYGTTELNESDLDYFDMVNSFLTLVDGILKKEGVKIDDAENPIKILQEMTEIKREKILQYVNISRYKHNLEVIGQVITDIRDLYPNIAPPVQSGKRQSIDNDCPLFPKNFDSIVERYHNALINEETFIEEATSYIEEFFDLPVLGIGDEPMTPDEAIHFSETLAKFIADNDMIAFVVIQDNNDKVWSEAFTKDIDNVSSSIQDFVFKVYPEINKCGEFRPKYNIQILTIPRTQKGSDENG